MKKVTKHKKQKQSAKAVPFHSVKYENNAIQEEKVMYKSNVMMLAVMLMSVLYIGCGVINSENAGDSADTNAEEQSKTEYPVDSIVFPMPDSPKPAGTHDGPDDETSLMNVSDEPAGENCPAGGTKIEVGLDNINRNGLLDPDEIDDVAYICNELDVDNETLQGSLVINNGDRACDDKTVFLNLSAKDNDRVIEMQFSNDGLDWTDWETYSAYKPWELEASNATELGVKTVHARVKNTAGNVSAVFSDTIELNDNNAPEGAILIDNGSELTNFNNVNLKFDVQDNIRVEQMRLSDDGENFYGWMKFSSEINYETLSGKVCAQFKDGSGNLSETVCDTINLKEDILDDILKANQKRLKGREYILAAHQVEHKNDFYIIIAVSNENGSGNVYVFKYLENKQWKMAADLSKKIKNILGCDILGMNPVFLTVMADENNIYTLLSIDTVEYNAEIGAEVEDTKILLLNIDNDKISLENDIASLLQNNVDSSLLKSMKSIGDSLSIAKSGDNIYISVTGRYSSADSSTGADGEVFFFARQKDDWSVINIKSIFNDNSIELVDFGKSAKIMTSNDEVICGVRSMILEDSELKETIINFDFDSKSYKWTHDLP